MFDYSFEKICASDRLELEIKASNISIALDYITTTESPENTTIFFKAELSENEETTLNTLVNAHENTPLEENRTVNVKITEDVASARDSDGATLSRIKITQTGWNYKLHGFELETCKLNSIIEKNASNEDYNFSTLKFYDTNNTLLTTQQDIDNSCVKTVLDWEPSHNYELMGGEVRQLDIPTSDIRLAVVGVPDIPEVSGGSKVFVSNVNLKFIGLASGVRVDGRAPKLLNYSATYHTNKIRFTFFHIAGIQHKLSVIMEIFKP